MSYERPILNPACASPAFGTSQDHQTAQCVPPTSDSQRQAFQRARLEDITEESSTTGGKGAFDFAEFPGLGASHRPTGARTPSDSYPAATQSGIDRSKDDRRQSGAPSTQETKARETPQERLVNQWRDVHGSLCGVRMAYRDLQGQKEAAQKKVLEIEGQMKQYEQTEQLLLEMMASAERKLGLYTI